MTTLSNITTTGQDFVDFLIETFGKGNIGMLQLQEGLHKFEALRDNKNKMFSMRETNVAEYNDCGQEFARMATIGPVTFYVRSLVKVNQSLERGS